MLSGFVNVNKPEGEFSGNSVGRVKYLVRRDINEKLPIGHMGTLDPMAQGVLPIGIGRATRLFDYLLNKKKVYIAKMRFGEETDTLDSTGKVVFSGGRVPSFEEIKSHIALQIGNISQIPPQYSAKSVGGVRAYTLARQGIEVSLKPKQILIDNIEILSYEDNEYTLRITCGGGTYIRSIIRDIGYSMDTYATMTALKRVQSGAFAIDNAVDLVNFGGNIKDIILPMDYAIGEYTRVDIDSRQYPILNNGLAIDSALNNCTCRVYLEDSLVSMGEVQDNKLKLTTRLI